MTRLTEEMVVARSKQSDLSAIKKLNCWGAELSDVSILKRMVNVEVLALSINKIRSLVDFQHCPRLKELYVRKNRIGELAEIRHLRALPHLKVLWLDENPCAEAANYRMTVLRALPRLEKLDNVPVQAEEVEEAVRKGTPIVDSDGDDDYESELNNCNWKGEDSSSERNSEREDYRNGEQELERVQEAYESPAAPGGYGRPSLVRRSPPTTNGTRNNQEYDDAPPIVNHSYGRPSALPRSPPNTNGNHMQTSPVRQRCYSPEPEEPRYEQPPSRGMYFEQEYSPMNGDHSQQSRLQQQGNTTTARRSMDMTSPQECYYERAERYASQNLAPSEQQYYQQQQQQQRERERDRERQQEQWERDSIVSAANKEAQIPSAVMADHKGFTRRPITRNSNLLSAVLCLVKELDYNSLEVAEMAVRCRMDELANRQ